MTDDSGMKGLVCHVWSLGFPPKTRWGYWDFKQGRDLSRLAS